MYGHLGPTLHYKSNAMQCHCITVNDFLGNTNTNKALLFRPKINIQSIFLFLFTLWDESNKTKVNLIFVSLNNRSLHCPTVNKSMITCLVICQISSVLALLSKEQGITVLGACIVYFFIARAKCLKMPSDEWVLSQFYCLCIAFILIVLNVYCLKNIIKYAEISHRSWLWHNIIPKS